MNYEWRRGRGALGSAPAPGAVFRALAENIVRTEMFRAFLAVSRASGTRGAFATPVAGVLPGTETAHTE
jgi:hypothetical protein